jgi:ABC-2 type transport system permease protein
VSSTDTAELTRVIAPRRSFRQHLVQLWAYRELLGNLVRKELKVKYKGSALGFVWSLLNPMMYLVIFYIAFQVILRAQIPSFPIFLLSGLLAWNFFSIASAAAVGSISGAASLVNKVYFPREILPLAGVGANLVHLGLQASVLAVTLIAIKLYKAFADLSPETVQGLPSIELEYAWLVVPALITLIILTSAMAIFVSCVNVYARDTQHLLELALLAWFWMTPIVFPWGLQARGLGDRSAMWTLVNPMTSVVIAFQRALYGIERRVLDGQADARGIPLTEQLLPSESPLWYFQNLVVVSIIGLVLLWLAVRLFDRLEGNFAEEL